MSDETIETLREIGLREHAALVGVLAERNELISRAAIYKNLDGSAPDAGQCLAVDTGIMLIAMNERLGGNSAEAESALRYAIFCHAKNHGTDMTGRSEDDIDFTLANVMLSKWRENPTDWLTSIMWASCTYFYKEVEHYDRKQSSDIIGSIGGDVWRLYAGTLSVLGKPTNRRWFGDDN